MADVDMPDAGTTPKTKAPVKTAKGGDSAAGDGKKRFEVKKVQQIPFILPIHYH